MVSDRGDHRGEMIIPTIIGNSGTGLPQIAPELIIPAR
jgi:hypothetical protein